MATATIFTLFLFLFLLILTSLTPQTQSQQEYVNNKQLTCDPGPNSTLGNLCNSVPTCQSYLTFRSSVSPSYNTPPSISYLLNSTPSLIASSNNITDADVIPSNTLVTVPITCSCSNRYYQHNATYTIKIAGESYFSIANNTYQSLTTCQSMIAQNHYGVLDLKVGETLHVPLRCACPTKKQSDAGYKYLLTYLVSRGESVSSIAQIFGVDEQSIWDANELAVNSTIFYFTPISVPLKTEPPKRIQSVAAPPPQSPPPPQTPADNGGSGSSKKWVIIGVVIGVVVLLLVAVALFFLCFYPRRHQSPLPSLPVAKPFSDSSTAVGIKKGSNSDTTTTTTQSWSISTEGVRYAIDSLTVYKFEDLQNATGFFGETNRIKGSVYRASFKGDDAAVKILKGDVSSEINILKRLNHTNVIRLSGFCVHKGNTYLVYEFAENGDLDDWLHNKEKKHALNSGSLSWNQRVQVAHDVADALNYLQNYTNPPHVHKNLKSGNVLLDANFRAKVSNFGLARTVEEQGEEGVFQLTRHVVGTQGYMPPEYIENGVITPKMDVFAFGVLILELISGREAVVANGGGEKVLLSNSVNQVLEGDGVREKLKGFMDPGLKGEYPLELAYSMAELAKRCIASDINSRPNVAEVFMTLSKIHSSTLDWDPSDELERSISVGQMSDDS